MRLHETAEKYAKIILGAAAARRPATLQDLYGFCEALDGGSQHFVRQAVTQLAADCKIEGSSAGIYGPREARSLKPRRTPTTRRRRSRHASGRA